MPTTTKVKTLKINRLTEAQYDAAVQAGQIGENEISILTDVDAGQVIQVDTLPTAAVEELDKIYQFIGTTDANYTNGYFYKCVSDGQNPATYSWTQTNVQPTPSGLPDQTGQSGKFLTTDGTDASWSDKPLVNGSNATNALSIYGNGNNQSDGIVIGYGAEHLSGNGGGGVIIGTNASAGGDSVAVGYKAKHYFYSGGYGVSIGNNSSSYDNSIAIGTDAKAGYANYSSIQIGKGTNPEKNTMYVGLHNNTSWVNYKLLGSDGTIPTDRFTTTPVAAGTYSATLTVDAQGNVTRSWATAADPLPSQTGNTGKFLTTNGTTASWATVDPLPSQTGNAGKVLMTDGTTASWVDIGSTPQTMPTLVAANWSSNTQTVNVTGVTATNVVMVSPAPVNATEYAQCGILCTAQANGTLTFTCTSVPSNDITVNVVCF